MPTRLYTIGHSNHALDHFTGLLKAHGVQLLVDVRSQPYSRFCPHFTRDALRVGIQSAGIDYRFSGQDLGGRPENPALFDEEKKPRYDLMAAQNGFQRGIAELVQLAGETCTAVMCSEEDPSMCHRRHLITPALDGFGIEIVHIRGDGTVESEQELVERESDDDQLTLFKE